MLPTGGFAGGLAAELLHYPLQRIEVVEEDVRAFAMIRVCGFTMWMAGDSSINCGRMHASNINLFL